MLTLAGSVAVLGYSNYRDLGKRQELTRNEVRDLNAELVDLNAKGEQVQQRLTPEQRALLVGAHRLVANKSFGWSRLFVDLESVMPTSVSASRIAVQNVYRDGDTIRAQLEMTALSRDYRDVLGMIDEMNRSGLFSAELRSQNLQENERLRFTEFTMNLIYSPRTGAVEATEPAKGGSGN